MDFSYYAAFHLICCKSAANMHIFCFTLHLLLPPRLYFRNLVDSAGFGEVGEYYSNDCQVKLDRHGVVIHGKSKSSMKRKKLILGNQYILG